jgi:DNA-nicking Smr family endonuclease
MEPIEVPIEDELDLHTFHPRDIPDLLPEYFTACKDKGIFSVRIIHGKGKGILKKRVHEILTKSPLVESFEDAPAAAGSWGATIVELKR